MLYRFISPFILFVERLGLAIIVSVYYILMIVFLFFSLAVVEFLKHGVLTREKTEIEINQKCTRRRSSGTHNTLYTKKGGKEKGLMKFSTCSV